VTTDSEPQSSDRAAAERAAAIAEFQRRDKWRRRFPLLPALLFTIVVTQIPFLFNIWFSLQDWKIVPPRGPDFVGLENYTQGYDNRFFFNLDITDPIGSLMGSAVGVSIFMTTAAVLLSLLVGTGLALLLDRQFFGRGLARTLLITPFLIMPVVAGLLWKNQIFSATFGVLNAVIEPLGIDAIPFVERYPFWAIVTVLVWQWSPFMMLIILAGLQGQPTDILEAARVDRASGRGIFTQITLPMLRPYMELGIVLGAIYLLQVFDHIDVMTGGGPGSTNVPYFVYQRSIGGGWDFGQAAAYSIIVVIATIIIATVALRVLSSLFQRQESV
jgi:sorbitol/mannitol transport system permease protein